MSTLQNHFGICNFCVLLWPEDVRLQKLGYKIFWFYSLFQQREFWGRGDLKGSPPETSLCFILLRSFLFSFPFSFSPLKILRPRQLRVTLILPHTSSGVRAGDRIGRERQEESSWSRRRYLLIRCGLRGSKMPLPFLKIGVQSVAVCQFLVCSTMSQSCICMHIFVFIFLMFAMAVIFGCAASQDEEHSELGFIWGWVRTGLDGECGRARGWSLQGMLVNVPRSPGWVGSKIRPESGE